MLGRQGVQFGVTMLLAYLLSPKDFGLMAMLGVFLALGSTMMDSGFTQALIRLDNPGQKDYSTAFYTNLLLGLVVYCLLFATSPLIASFYEEPKLTVLVRVVGLAIVFNAFQMVQVAKLSRALNFKAQLQATLPASVLSGGGAIFLASLGLGVWALVGQMLTSAILVTLFLWMQRIWRPSFEFSGQSLMGMYQFGYKLFLSGVIATVFKNLYVLAIAKSFSIGEAGMYFFADKVKDMLVMQMVAAIQNVTYPALATKKNNVALLKGSSRKLIRVMTFFLFPFLLVFSALTPVVFELFLPEKWGAASFYLQLMIVASLMAPINSVNLNILKVVGRSDLFLFLEVLKKSMLAIILFFSIDFGVVGVMVGQIVQSFLGAIINSFFTKKLIGYSLREQVSDFFPALFLASIIAGFVFFGQFEFYYPPILELIAFSVMSAIFYLSISKILGFSQLNFFISLLFNRFSKKTRAI